MILRNADNKYLIVTHNTSQHLCKYGLPIQTNTESTGLDTKIDVLNGEEAGNDWPVVFLLMDIKSPARPAQNRYNLSSIQIQSTRWQRITLCSAFPDMGLPMQTKH